MIVRLCKEQFSFVRNKQVKLGTQGKVLAMRQLPGPGSEKEALVKFKGYSWPISVYFSKLEIVEQ